MKKLFLSLLLLSGPLWAGSYTDNAGIYLPDDHETNWGEFMRNDFQIIDSSFAILPIDLNSEVTGILPASNMVSTAVFTNKQNVFTDTNNFQSVSASSLSVNGPLNISGLTANQCVQTSANGLLTTSGASCGGSGGVASKLGVNQNGISITTPTFALNALSPPFLLTAVGSGATAQWALDGSSVTMKGTNVIGLQSTLQSGSTFFVSSGTVNGQLTANKIVASTLTITGNTLIDTLRVTGSGGLTVDNLSAGQCVQAGTGGLLTVTGSACAGTGNFIANTSTLQSGSTFYVSSGTVRGPLIASSYGLYGGTGLMVPVNGGMGILDNSGNDFFFSLSGGGYVKTGIGTSFAQVSGDGLSLLVIKSSYSNVSGGANIYTWPDVDGTSGQVLTTDGTKKLSFSTVSGGAGGSGIVSPGTFTWTNTRGITVSTLTATSTATLRYTEIGNSTHAQKIKLYSQNLPVNGGFGPQVPTSFIAVNAIDDSGTPGSFALIASTQANPSFGVTPSVGFLFNPPDSSSGLGEVVIYSSSYSIVDINGLYLSVPSPMNIIISTADAILGTDSSGIIISTTVNLGSSKVNGTLAAGRFPALTGDITTTAGSLATTAAASQSNIKTLAASSTTVSGILVVVSTAIFPGTVLAGTTTVHIATATITIVPRSNDIYALQIATSVTSNPLVSISTIPARDPTDFKLSISSTNGTFIFGVQNNSHVVSSGTVIPVLSSCGTGPSINGSDAAGTVTGGATSGGCVVTFGVPYPLAPHCVVTPQTGSVANTFSYTVSATAITVTETSFGTGKFDYICVAGQGT